MKFNALNRAMKHMVLTGVILRDEEKGTKKTFDAADLTYVAAVLVAFVELIRFVLIFAGNKN